MLHVSFHLIGKYSGKMWNSSESPLGIARDEKALGKVNSEDTYTKIQVARSLMNTRISDNNETQVLLFTQVSQIS